MATQAVLSLKFQDSLGVTVKDDGTWTVDSDPKGLIAEEGGSWRFEVDFGTRLNGANEELITLEDWNLTSAAKGQKGQALFNPSLGHAMGDFEVMAVS